MGVIQYLCFMLVRRDNDTYEKASTRALFSFLNLPLLNQTKTNIDSGREQFFFPPVYFCHLVVYQI